MVGAVIFAGGTGQRMSSKSKPKQMLTLHGKPILLHTIEIFQLHQHVDKIIVVCLSELIQPIRELLRKNEIYKIVDIVPGGFTGFESIYNGLIAFSGVLCDDDLVIIHDGVRPLVSANNITDCIECAKNKGNAVSTIPVTTGIVVSKNGYSVDEFPERSVLYATQAPQVYQYKQIIELYQKAIADNYIPIESAHLCQHYGVEINMVRGSSTNIKITTATDYYIFRAIYEAIENNQIIGYES